LRQQHRSERHNHITANLIALLLIEKWLKQEGQRSMDFLAGTREDKGIIKIPTTRSKYIFYYTSSRIESKSFFAGNSGDSALIVTFLLMVENQPPNG
jgi:hypothetical protein